MKKTIVYGSLLLSGGVLSEISSYLYNRDCNKNIFKQTFELSPIEYGSVEYSFRKVDNKLFAILNFSSDLIEDVTIEINEDEDLYKIYFYENDKVKVYITVNLDCSFWYYFYADILGKISEYEDLFVKFVSELDLDEKKYSIFDLAHILFRSNHFSDNTEIIKNKKVLKLLYDKLSLKYTSINIDGYSNGQEIHTKGIEDFNTVMSGIILSVLKEIQYNDSYLKSDKLKILKNKVLGCCIWHQVLYLNK